CSLLLLQIHFLCHAIDSLRVVPSFPTRRSSDLLCIQPSRKQSVLSAWHRFLACILASLFSFVFFETLGYHIIVVGLMLALFIPTDRKSTRLNSSHVSTSYAVFCL